MRLGLVSDTHDNTPLVAHVAALFRARRVDTVFHLGDVTQPGELDAFAGLPLVVVRGNNDEEEWPQTWRQEFAGVRVGATHGHLRGQLASLMGDCDVVLHGHTHRRRAEMVGKALVVTAASGASEDQDEHVRRARDVFVVNPGALHRAATRTCALLELPSKKVVFYGLDLDGARRLDP